jgi:hypothetical protein
VKSGAEYVAWEDLPLLRQYVVRNCGDFQPAPLIVSGSPVIDSMHSLTEGQLPQRTQTGALKKYCQCNDSMMSLGANSCAQIANPLFATVGSANLHGSVTCFTKSRLAFDNNIAI